MKHRIGRTVFALTVGLAVAFYSYHWVTNPEPRAARAAEEQAVEASRELLRSFVPSDTLEIVDPLAPNRKVGKVYVYAEGPGWAVSGYFRRSEGDRWHPYLLSLGKDYELVHMKVKDAKLADAAAADPRLEVVP